MQEIIIDIERDGSVKFEGKGFVGAECDTLMKAVEDAVGTVTNKVYKPEYRATRQMGRTVGR